MKRNKLYILIIGIVTIIASCSEEKLNPVSQIKDPSIAQNDFDKWLYKNYTVPYNIQFNYRFVDSEADMNYNLEPAETDKAVRMANMVKHLVLEAYDEMTGSSAFMRSYYPKVVQLVGSPAYNNNGTAILATAEGGHKIILMNINSMSLGQLTDADFAHYNYVYFHTLHHEFAHILHQTKPYSRAFNQISGADYVQDSWMTVYTSDAAAQKAGFISAYASSAVDEDFVETYSLYLVTTSDSWNALIAAAGANGQIIMQKLAIVKDYMLTSWGINMDTMRSIVLRRQQDLFSMNLDSLN